MATQRIHREWFMPVQTAAGRTTCPCGMTRKQREAQGGDTSLYACGEYSRARWSTWDYCCRHCFQSRIVRGRLLPHAAPCGCTFELQPRSGYRLPDWMVLPAGFNSCPTKAA
jgi:hypothetical protein